MTMFLTSKRFAYLQVLVDMKYSWNHILKLIRRPKESKKEKKDKKTAIWTHTKIHWALSQS